MSFLISSVQGGIPRWRGLPQLKDEGCPAYGTRRPQERPPERTFAPARHRRAEKHDSNSRERSDRRVEGRHLAPRDRSRRRFAKRCDGTVSKPGVLTLPAKNLFEIVSALPETDIRIEEEKGGKASRSRPIDSSRASRRCPRASFRRRRVKPAASRPRCRWRAEAADFTHAVCHHQRGHALLSERCPTRAATGFDEHGRD